MSFIDPNDIDDANDGALLDSTPDEQTHGRQGGEVGLFLEDDSLDVPVRRVLMPRFDTDSVSATDIKAHSSEITVNTGALSVGDYVMVGDETVRKVTAVATPTQMPTQTQTDWYITLPVNPSSPTDQAPIVALPAITLSGFDGAETVRVVIGSTPFMPLGVLLNDTNGNSLRYRGSNNIHNISAVAGEVVIEPGVEPAGNTVSGRDAGVYTITFSATSASVTDPVIHTLRIHLIGDMVALDKPFATAMEDPDVYKITISDTVLNHPDVNWSENYGLYAKAVELDATANTGNVVARGGLQRYRGDNVVVASNIASTSGGVARDTTDTNANNAGDALHRLTGVIRG